MHSGGLHVSLQLALQIPVTIMNVHTHMQHLSPTYM